MSLAKRRKWKNIFHFEDAKEVIKGNPKLYRIFKFEDILDILINKEITLVNPSLWEDPYESFILKCKATKPNGENIEIESVQKQFFGQCWTLEEESDAMWRIYSQDKTGVRVKSTFNKVFSIIYDDNEDKSMATSYISKVKYMEEKEMKEYFSNPENTKLLSLNGKWLVYLQSIKRKAFAHEREVRLMFFLGDSNSEEIGNKVKKFKVAPNDLIEEICFDPRLEERLYEVYKKTLEKIGYTGKITKSKLYDFEGVDVVVS